MDAIHIMPEITKRLLDQAYDYIEQDEIPVAKHILNVVVSRDPQMVEAWDLYMQICINPGERDQLARRVSQSELIKPENKRDVLAYYEFMNKNLEHEPIRVWYRKQGFTHALNIILRMGLPLALIAFFVSRISRSNNLLGFFIFLELAFMFVFWQGSKYNLKKLFPRSFQQESEFILSLEEEDAMEAYE